MLNINCILENIRQKRWSPEFADDFQILANQLKFWRNLFSSNLNKLNTQAGRNHLFKSLLAIVSPWFEVLQFTKIVITNVHFLNRHEKWGLTRNGDLLYAKKLSQGYSVKTALDTSVALLSQRQLCVCFDSKFSC